jgi:hypothetical protein
MAAQPLAWAILLVAWARRAAPQARPDAQSHPVSLDAELLAATLRGDTDAMETLLYAGASALSKDREGVTLLQRVAMQTTERVSEGLQLLVRHGAGLHDAGPRGSAYEILFGIEPELAEHFRFALDGMDARRSRPVNIADGRQPIQRFAPHRVGFYQLHRATLRVLVFFDDRGHARATRKLLSALSDAQVRLVAHAARRLPSGRLAAAGV